MLSEENFLSIVRNSVAKQSETPLVSCSTDVEFVVAKLQFLEVAQYHVFSCSLSIGEGVLTKFL
jgi:hypothetical protein